MMVDAMRNDFDHRFNDPEGKNIYLEMAYTHNLEDAEAFKKRGRGRIPGYGDCAESVILKCILSHWMGALAVACSKKDSGIIRVET